MKYYRTEKQRLYYEKVITLYRDQHMGKTRIAKIIPVSDWTISNWIRTFVAENPKYKNKRMKMAEEKRKQNSHPCQTTSSLCSQRWPVCGRLFVKRPCVPIFMMR